MISYKFNSSIIIERSLPLACRVRLRRLERPAGLLSWLALHPGRDFRFQLGSGRLPVAYRPRPVRRGALGSWVASLRRK